VLRRIFGPKREEATGGWGKFHYEEFHKLYSFTEYYYSDRIKEDGVGKIRSTHKR